MKLFRRWWFWVLSIGVIGLIGFFALKPSAPVEYVTEVITREALVQTVDANGEVVSLDEVELSFDLSGTVESILVSVGDAVGIGDLLAVLETDELIADVQSAYQAVQVAQGTLDAQKAGASEESIAVSQVALMSAQTDYDHAVALSPLIETVYLAQENVQSAALTSASDNVTQTIADNALLIADAYDDLLGSAWAGVIEARSAYSKGDEILGVHNTTLNDDYQNLLSSGNSSAVESAKTALTTLNSSLFSAETAIVSAQYGSSGTIVTAAEDVEEALDDAAALLLYIRMAVSAMPATGDLSVSEATTLASSIDTARVAVQVDQAALQNAFQTVQDALLSANHNLEDANNALAQAQASFDEAVASREYQLVVADQAISSAQAVTGLREAELAQAQAAPRVVDLASYEAEVARVQAAYASAQARLDRAEMRSPIVGDVTDVAIEVGEQVTATSAVITVQTTQEQFEIVADVSESDIAKLAIGQQAEITFDAFGSSQKLVGEVRKIDPAEKLIESVVYYEVTVSFVQEDQSLALRPGLSADLIFTTDRKEDALTISQRALQSRNGGTFVRVLKDGQVEERDVTIGLRGDLGRVEILSGLEEGEEIIIRELTP
ncbi:efflux RND transporter periplasmic adaptor subunit [Candidatus Uhrbacteria bacterium]|nr:efflux RND transporter periplasmic adaptor subunit [Candidatus Uhrbacteria bacterium]